MPLGRPSPAQWPPLPSAYLLCAARHRRLTTHQRGVSRVMRGTDTPIQTGRCKRVSSTRTPTESLVMAPSAFATLRLPAAQVHAPVTAESNSTNHTNNTTTHPHNTHNNKLAITGRVRCGAGGSLNELTSLSGVAARKYSINCGSSYTTRR